MGNLASKRCENCKPGTPALTDEQQRVFAQEVPEWKNIDGKHIQREYKFKTYMDGVAWVQQAGAIADSEDHHPDIHIFYRKVSLDLWTHTVNGLSENDYILAAKLDANYDAFPGKR
jgi:4a-hydroxytetrahydrobiopterin dehydratase